MSVVPAPGLSIMLGLAAALVVAALAPGLAHAQAPPLITEEPAIPSAEEVARAKFDPGFYEKVRDLADGGAHGANQTDSRYYGVVIVASRHGGDPGGAEGSKAALVERLGQMGALDIVPAEELSFVTARVPVGMIPDLSLMGEVYQLGDGEQELDLEPRLATAKSVVHATPAEIRAASGMAGLDGSGVLVATMENMYHPSAFGSRITKHISCTENGCTENPALLTHRDSWARHGVLVAQILGASGFSTYNGIAPGVSFINMPVGATATQLSTYVHAIDRLVGEGVDVINMSFGRPENCAPTTVFLVLNEAAGRGVVMVSSAGNEGKTGDAPNDPPNYGSISNPGCMRSVIAVGGINDQNPSSIIHNPGSSRGPGKDPSGANNILKPEIVAPATISGLIGERDNQDRNYMVTGTSFASPLVAGTAAILLQADPSLTPVEVRGALLLGARWTGPDQCNSAGYEAVDPDSGCSHAMQVTDGTLSDAEAMGVLNNMGLGILDTAASVRYVLDDGHVVAGQIGDSSDTRTYTFTVGEAGEQVKLIMTWLVDSQNPSQNRLNTERIYGTPNLDFVTTDPGGDRLDLASGTSAWQNTEFAVFDAPEAGTYTVTVGGSGLEAANQRGLGFSLASTHPLGRAPGPDGLPEGEGRTAVFEPGRATKILLEADDPDGDPVSFRVSKDPRSGTLSGVIPSGDASYVVYEQAGSTPDRFSAVPYDGTGEGGQFTVRMVPESLPDGARSDGARLARTNGTDVLEIPDGSVGPLSVLFPGRDYPVKYVQLYSANMIEPVAEIRTPDGAYTVSVPDGYRRIILEDPTMISSVAISAGGIDAGFAHRTAGGPARGTHVSVGYLGVAPEKEGAPEVSPAGPDPHHVAVSGGTYGDVDPGATCTDDAGSTSYTSNSSSVPLDAQKRFTVAYTCADETGYSSSATRVVIVDDGIPGRPIVESGGRIGAGEQLPDATCADVRGEGTRLNVTLRDINGRAVPRASTDAPGSYVATYECRNADGMAGTPVSRDITVGFDGGAPLYMDIARPVRTACGGEPLPPGEAAYGTAGLSVSLPYDSADRVSYIEVQAGSTGRSLAIYNFTVDGDRLTALVPPGALGFITGSMPGETFSAYAIESSIFIDRHQLSITSGSQLASLDGKLFRYVDHPGVGQTQYSKFDHISEYTALNSGRLYEFDGSKLVQQRAVISNPEVLLVTCHAQVEARTAVDGPDPPPAVDISGGSPPAITGAPPGGIIHFRAGAAVPWHGMSCTDGGVDVAITPPPGVGVDAGRNGTVDVEYSCTDGSATDTETITYLVDGTPPVVAPPGGSADIEVGDAFSPVAGSCRDPYPDPASYDGINEPSAARSGHSEGDVRGALEGRSLGTFVTIFECEDAAGNVARSTLTRNVVDTRVPNPPTVSRTEVTSTAPEPIDYGDVSCDPGDTGTPLRLVNDTTRDGLTYAGAIDPSVPGTYVVSYMCADASQSSSPVVQTVSVEPGAAGAGPPELAGGPPDGQIHFKRGDPVPAHGLTCRAGGLDLTSTIAPNATVDKDVQGMVPVKYTCTHAGESAERTVTYVVDGTAPELVATRVHSGNLENPHKIRFDLHGHFDAEIVGCVDEYPAANLDHEVVRDGEDAIREAYATKTEILGAVVTYNCMDRAGNKAAEGRSIFDVIDRRPPGKPSVSPLEIDSTEGEDVDLGDAACTQDGGSRVHVRSNTYRDGMEIFRPGFHGTSGPYVDVSVPGTYEVRYWCADARHSSGVVTQTVTINPRPVLLSGQPAGPIRLKVGDAVPAHGITCTDLSANPGEAPETVDGAVDPDMNGTQYVTYRCADDGGRAEDVRVTYIVDGTPPVISVPGASVLELGSEFEPEGATCTDPYPRERIGAAARTGEDAVRAALASGMEHPGGITVTYTCTDAVGNDATAKTAFTVLDRTPPAEPDLDTRSVVSVAGRMIDYGASCAQDGGTPVILGNMTYKGDEVIGRIDASEPGSYRVDYVCADSKHRSNTVMQHVTILAGGGASDFSAPPATGVYVRNASHYDPGDVCGTPVTYMPALKGLEDGRHQVVASCGADDARVEIIVDSRPPDISLDGGGTHYLMPVMGGTYLDADPGYECTDEPPGIVDTHGSDAGDHPISANGTFEVSYTCRDAAGNVRNETRDVEVDGGRPAPPAVDGTDSTYRIEVGTAFAPPEMRCVQDGGSPVHPAARLAFYDGAGARIPGISGSAPVGSYEMDAWCEDAAGNRSYVLDHFVVTVEPPAPVRSDDAVSLLEGGGDAHVMTVSEYRHTLVCRPDGTNPDNSRLLFDPPLDMLRENHANRVNASCPDPQNRVGDSSTKEVTITLDTHGPVVSVPAVYARKTVIYVWDGNQNTAWSAIQPRFRCVDALDTDPVRSTSFERERVDHLDHLDELTPHVIADHVDEDGNAHFDVFTITCEDAAGNELVQKYPVVQDRRLNPFADVGGTVAPVISIEKMVREVPFGSSYTFTDEDRRCGDYTPHQMGDITYHAFLRGLQDVRHLCADSVGFGRYSMTQVFVPFLNGPAITIHQPEFAVKRGDQIPIDGIASCVDSGGSPLPVTIDDNYFKFFSVNSPVKFKPSKAFSYGLNEWPIHVVYTCTDSIGRLAAASAEFVQVASTPQIGLTGITKENRRETLESAFRNAHIAGTAYEDPGADCYYHFDDPPDRPITATENVPDEDTRPGTLLRVGYVCTSDDGEETTKRHRVVKVLERKVIEFDSGSPVHEGGAPLRDDARCLGFAGPVETPAPVITGPDGAVDQIGISTPAGTYTLTYTCTDTPFDHEGLGSQSQSRTFTRELRVTETPDTPVILLDGPDPVAVVPGKVFEEPGYSCMDRPGGENVTASVTTNGTGYVMGFMDTVVRYDCEDGDGNPARTVYRTLLADRTPQITIGEVLPVEKKSLGANLPTATCTLFGGETVELAPKMKGIKSRTTKIGDHRVVISPTYEDNYGLPFDAPTRTHTITFTCTSGGLTGRASAEFIQVNPNPSINVPGLLRTSLGETARSQLANLRLAGDEYSHDGVQCRYYKEPGLLSVGDPGFEVTGSVGTAPGVYNITYTCSPESAGERSRSAPRTVSVLERAVPAVTGAEDVTHTGPAPFADTVGCSGIFGDSELRPDIPEPVLSSNITRGGELVDRVAEEGVYEITYRCTESYLGRVFASETAARTVKVPGSTITPPPPGPVLTLGAPEVHLKPRDTHKPPLECTLDGAAVNADIMSNDTSISRIIDGVQNVTAPDEEGAYGVKYTCTSGGQTADNMPEFRVVSDGTGPAVAVNASLPVVSGQVLAPTDFPISKVYACVDTYDPSPTMEANGQGGSYMSGGFVPGDQFIPNTEALVFASIRCTDEAGNVGEGTASYTTRPPPITMGIGGSPAYLMPGATHDPQVTCTVGSDQLTDMITSSSPISVVVDGKHQITAPDTDADDTTITYTCARDGLATQTRTFRVVTDGIGPAPPTAPGGIDIDFGTAYDPDDNNVRCASDSGSPVLPDAEFKIFDSDDNEVAAITTTTPAGTYDVNYTCVDEAGNAGPAATQVVTIRDTSAPSGPATALVGTAPDAYTDTPAGYVHGLTCEEDGVAVGNDRILFNPPLANLAENANNTVTIYCPDTQGLTSRASNQTVHIIYDTEDPEIHYGRELALLDDTIGLVAGESLADHVRCTDNLDADPAAEYSDDNLVSYKALGEFDASSPHTARDIDFRCVDRAGNDPTDQDFPDPASLLKYVRTVKVYPAELGIARGTDGDGARYGETLYYKRGAALPGGLAVCGDGTLEYSVDGSGPYRGGTDGRYVLDLACTDELGRGSDTVRYVVYVDGVPPAPPTGVVPAHSLDVGEEFVPRAARGAAACEKAVDPESPVVLANVTLDSGGAVAAIDTLSEGSYRINYTCVDGAENRSPPVTQAVTVKAAPGRGSDPEITGTGVIHFRQGTTPEPHGLTCSDGDADLTSTITGDITVDENTQDGNATVTYTCTDERESKTDTHKITYIVDGTPPVISPPTGTVTLELGETFTPEDPTCTDPYPRAEITQIDRAGRPAVEAALLSKAESEPEITYDCEDAVGNPAIQSVRTFEIRDTTAPAAPVVSRATVTVAEGAMLDLGVVACTQDDGTPVSLRNVTTLDNNPHTGPIDTSVPGTYVVTYTCNDAKLASEPAQQTVTVDPAPGRGADPEITGVDVIHFRQGTAPEPHGLTCSDGDADLTSTITADRVVDSATPTGNATVTYTCTDERESKTDTHKIIYIVDGTAPVISPPTGTVQLELGGTFSPEDPTCTDPYPEAKLEVARAGRPAVEAALLSKAESEPEITYDCEDAVGNPAIQSVRTFEIRDTTAPAAPVVSRATVTVAEGAMLDLGVVACTQDDGTPVSLRNVTTLDNNPHTGPIDTSVPGTYVVTYTCNDAKLASEPAQQTVTVDPAPGRGADPEITGTGVIHFRQGTTPEPHGLACTDGGVDLTSTITADRTVDDTTQTGNATVTYTCTDERESKTVTHKIIYIVDGTAPVISPPTGTVQLELGGTFEPEMVTCTDPYPRAEIAKIDRDGRDAVEAALSSKAESDPVITYDCDDAVGNPATQSVRTFEIRDTTAPAAPVVSRATVTVAEDAIPDLGDVTCAQDRGTLVSLQNVTTLDNNPHAGPIDTSRPGTYEITYTCHDAKQAGEPAVQTVTVEAAPGRGADPEITGREVIHFRQGTAPDAHGLTCADGSVDLTGTITGDITVDENTQTGNVTVTYTCTDERESKTATHKITYIVDGTVPVISPQTGTIQLELGETFTPEIVTCTDPYPRAAISNIERAGRDIVEAALSSNSESEPEITYDCTDAVGNPAVQSVRTFEIRDTTRPVITFSHDIREVEFRGAYEEPAATCTDLPRPASSAIPNTGETVDTGAAGTYTESYTCDDGITGPVTVTRAVVVNAALNTPPEILLNYMNNSNVEVGTDPTATCRDAEDGDSPAARTGGEGFDVDDGTFGFAEDSRAKPYTFTYTCTDTGGLTNSTTGVITQVSDVPHLAITAFDYNADGKMTFAALVDTFHRLNNDYTQEDPKCYHHSVGEIQRDTEYIPEISDKVKEAIRDDLGPHDVTHTCTVDGRSNTLVHTVYTISRDLPAITIRPGPEAIHALGDIFEPLSTCSPLFGDDLPLEPSIVDVDGTEVGAIDESTPRGKYVITYSCTQTIEETDHHERVTIEAAAAMLTVDVTERIKPRLVVPNDRIVHPLGEALDLAAIGVTCADGEGSATLEHDPPITASTPPDAIDVAVTCTDESGNYVRRTVEVVITDMDTPLITLLGDPVITSEGHLFRDPGASCTDVQDGRLGVTTETTRYGTDGAAEIGEPGRYEMTYHCTDSDGNKAEPVTRTVHVGRVGDALPPVISINGFSTTMIETGDAYLDGGAVCSDANYGDLPVVVREEVDAARPGSYSVTYTCTDGTFTSTAKRTVDVVAEVPEDVTPPEIRIPSGFEEFAAMDTGSTQTAGPVGALPPPGSTAAGGATGIIDPAGNATFAPAPSPGGAASSHADRLPHRQGTEFVPPILWCVDGINYAGEEIRTASNSSHMITTSTAAGHEEVTYTCKDAAGNIATQVVLRVEVEEEGRPAAASLHGSRTISLEPGQVYREEGAMCDDGRFNRPARQLLPVIQPGSDNPAEFSKPGRYEISYACEAAGTMSGIITRIIIVKPGGSSEEDWQLNPTFGLSWLDNTQAVRGGFSFDGRYVDVTDNFHASFARIDAAVGEEHVVTAKAYSERDLERFTIYLGVPDVSRATDAEAEIAIDVTPDSAAESWYSILGTSHEQEDPLVDVDHTRAEIRRVACSPGSDIKCLEVEVAFRVMAPLSSDIMAISAMDTERRVTVTYVNDGVTFTGDSLLPPRTASFTFRAGNQHPAEEVHLVQKDRRYNVWEDQHGFAWLQNQYGSWTQVTHAEFERLADPAVSVVTRHHDSFADLLRAEQERAALVFNATDLQREVGGSFSHDAPVRVEKLKDPAILERLHISELAALEYLGRP
ncbi:MAG: DUF5011 domain-containing protein [Nitrosopumilus sp.]|nr:DUF5011 domain-containing protein [Nitrosopumilus sp.]